MPATVSILKNGLFAGVRQIRLDESQAKTAYRDNYVSCYRLDFGIRRSTQYRS
jgi:hypothetical protein